MLQALSDIKHVLAEVKTKQIEHDGQINGKVDKKDLESLRKDIQDLQRWRYYLAGGLFVIQILVATILKG